ncbi:LOW QUALITY PROTEIN: EPIDERMAL PATTERNING FACTOR-like protein 1 [Oryza sativa Japonica Group]|uniref:LOW QUALITY PROTEIN: EPIDERMAL PATTERNING FACTOR-like protein 1 n=1 Tax=Oryza sativa subsp. japonica TaxID=39947 RepID=UPI000E1C32A7|nr:LOW QUALITY PROTEIN: EPIDERMAL PATTERNING FACTOR-like protein 1 [Oryza sativa Japonica Group]
MRTAATPPLAAAAAAVAAVFLSALLLASASASASRLPPPRRLLPLVGGEVAVAVVAGEEEKVRLGSSPPSCYSKCYGCSPCVAVQVPTLSAPSVPAARAAHDAAPLVATFTNYKPLGWKCQCRDRLFDP